MTSAARAAIACRSSSTSSRAALNPRERVPLGRTALTVTRFGLGTAPLAGLFEAVDEAQGIAVIERAWDKGIRFYDTAPLYGHGLAEIRLREGPTPKTLAQVTPPPQNGRPLPLPRPP